MTFQHRMAVLLLLLLLPFVGCNRNGAVAVNSNQTPVRSPGATPSVTVEIYHGKGTITAAKPEVPSIELDHEEIVGLMPAMKMEFYVKDVSLLTGLKPGDRIEFKLENGVGGLQITEIKKLN